MVKDPIAGALTTPSMKASLPSKVMDPSCEAESQCCGHVLSQGVAYREPGQAVDAIGDLGVVWVEVLLCSGIGNLAVLSGQDG